MVKNSNISKDQWLFLKGHIEAILILCSIESSCVAFDISSRVEFCNTSTVISMILKPIEKDMWNSGMDNVRKTK